LFFEQQVFQLNYERVQNMMIVVYSIYQMSIQGSIEKQKKTFLKK
jgi:hypothetical protein